MNIAGSIHANLRAALQSARRLRDGPVHPDTVDHWSSLVRATKAEHGAMESFKTRKLMSDLEREINAHGVRWAIEITTSAKSSRIVHTAVIAKSAARPSK